MESYVSGMLARLKGFIDEYGQASEVCRQAHLEYRECTRSFALLEDERVCLETTLRVWSQHPGVKFDEREKLETAAATLKSLRGKLPWTN